MDKQEYKQFKNLAKDFCMYDLVCGKNQRINSNMSWKEAHSILMAEYDKRYNNNVSRETFNKIFK